ALTINSLAAPPPGTTLELVEVAGSQSVTGTFAGLADGSVIDLGGVPGVVTYHGGDGNDVTVTAQPAGYVPVVPRRVLETRGDVPGGQVGYSGSRPRAGQTVELSIPDLPLGTGSVVLNVTAANSAVAGFVTVWPCGSPQPTASNLNPAPVTGATANLVV